MTKPIRTEPEADEELLEAARWYEQRRRGLGLDFLAAIEAAVELIQRYPAGCRGSRTRCPLGDWYCDDSPTRWCS